MKIIDLTHHLDEKTPVYPNSKEQPPQIEQIASVEHDGYSLYHLNSDMHIGTHIDAPAHMLADGKRIDEIPIERFCSTAKIIDARGHNTIDIDLLENIDLEPGESILILTGFDKKIHDKEYFTAHPILTKEFVDELIKHNVNMVGFDMPSPDRYPFEQHKQLFAPNILIIENLTNLDQLLDAQNIELIALPLKIAADGTLARVIARIW